MPWGDIFPVFEALSVDFTNATKQAVRPDTWPWNEFIQPVTVICHLGACRRSQQYRLGPCPPRTSRLQREIRRYTINQWKIGKQVLSEQYSYNAEEIFVKGQIS